MFVPSVVSVFIVYVPVTVFGIVMWYVPSWSRSTSAPSSYSVFVPFGEVTVIFVVPAVVDGITVKTTVSLFI